MTKVNIGVVGLGKRGISMMHTLGAMEDVKITAICDLYPDRVENGNKHLEENFGYTAKGYADYHDLVDDPNVDAVFAPCSWESHTPVCIYALRQGKRAASEVGGATSIDECWEIVETSEQTRRHCMMLENRCYGETEMLAWNLVHQGLLGKITHAEGGYIHNLTERSLANHFRNRVKKQKLYFAEYGNTYPTHPLGPICFYMDMNRGTTSVGSGSIQTYLFVPAESIDTDYYTEINLKLNTNAPIYTFFFVVDCAEELALIDIWLFAMVTFLIIPLELPNKPT